MKLTQAQARILLHGEAVISFNPLTASAWTTNSQGFTIKVRLQMFNSLALMGAIEKYAESTGTATGTHFYRLTDAGRLALDKAKDAGGDL